jgi:hypothetical protein
VDLQRFCVVIDAGHRGEGAVEHAEPAGVAQGDDAVADGEVPIADAKGRPSDAALLGEQVAGGGVQLGDVAVSQRDHHRRAFARALGCCPPVLDHAFPEPAGAAADDDAVVLGVSGDGGDGVAGAQQVERLLFPGFALAVVGLQRGGAEPADQASEQAPCLDLGELLDVADRDHLGAGVVGVGEQPGELAGADHPGFVDHQHGVRGHARAGGVIEVAEEPGDGAGSDAGALLQLPRSACGQGGADDAVARGLPGPPPDGMGRRVSRPAQTG